MYTNFADFLGIDWGTVNWTAITAIVAIIGITITLVTLIIKKAFNSGAVSTRLTNVENGINGVKQDVTDARNDLTKRIDEVLVIVAQKGLSESNSPRRLNDEGRRVLTNSGIDAIVDDKFDYVVEQVRAKNPQNPYQAEQATLSVVADLASDPTIKDAIEEGAFNSGYPVPSVLFTGGLYIRDRVLAELDMQADDIDQHDPSKNGS